MEYNEYPVDMDKSWYHGSPVEMNVLREGSTITQWKELAVAFSTKPSLLGYESIFGKITHNGTEEGMLYIIDEPIEMNIDIYQHPNTSMNKGIEFITKRPLKIKKIV